MGQADGTWNSHITTANASSICAADFDGDGNVDLAMVSEETQWKNLRVTRRRHERLPGALQLSLGNFPSDLAG